MRSGCLDGQATTSIHATPSSAPSATSAHSARRTCAPSPLHPFLQDDGVFARHNQLGTFQVKNEPKAETRTKFQKRTTAFNRSMQGPRYAMLVHLAMMLSRANGWKLAPDDKAHDSPPLSAYDSAITGEVDGGRARRQLASGCNFNWSVCAPAGNTRSYPS